MLPKKGLKLGKKGQSRKRKRFSEQVYFSRTSAENAQKALEELSHSEAGDNVGSQPHNIMSDSQSGRLCTRSEVSRLVIVESDRKEASASDEPCEDENSKFVGIIGLTKHPTACLGVKSRNVRHCLAQRELQSQQKFSPETRTMRHGFHNFSCKIVKQ